MQETKFVTHRISKEDFIILEKYGLYLYGLGIKSYHNKPLGVNRLCENVIKNFVEQLNDGDIHVD